MFNSVVKRFIVSICVFLNTSTSIHAGLSTDAVLRLPAPGAHVLASQPTQPLLLKGIRLDPKDPFQFDILLDTGSGSAQLSGNALKNDIETLVKYFLTGIVTPAQDLWVNLSPYERERMVPNDLGRTMMGSHLLAQDYLLKQLTASLIYPERPMGREFWSRVYAAVRNKAGSTDIPVNTFHKVWVVADRADIYEQGDAAYVTSARLKVMMEDDYMASRRGQGSKSTDTAATQIMRTLVLPAIEEEVNSGANFAPLRQMYYALLIAAWYKKNLMSSPIVQTYGDHPSTRGSIIHNDRSANAQIYARYLEAYKKGVFNYIKEDSAHADGGGHPKKYFSGGADFAILSHPEKVFNPVGGQNVQPAGKLMEARVRISPPQLGSSDSSKTAHTKVILKRLTQLGAEGRAVQALISEDPSIWNIVMGSPFLNDFDFWKPEGLEKRLSEFIDFRSTRKAYLDDLRKRAAEVYRFAEWILNQPQYADKKIVVLGRAAEPIYIALNALAMLKPEYANRIHDIFLMDFSPNRMIKNLHHADKVGVYFRGQLERRGLGRRYDQLLFVSEVSYTPSRTNFFLRFFLGHEYNFVTGFTWTDFEREVGRSYDGDSDNWDWSNWLDSSYDSGRNYSIEEEQGKILFNYSKNDHQQQWLNYEAILLEVPGKDSAQTSKALSQNLGGIDLNTEKIHPSFERLPGDLFEQRRVTSQYGTGINRTIKFDILSIAPMEGFKKTLKQVDNP